MAPYILKTHFSFRSLCIYGVFLFFGACFVLYVLFQARFLIAGPTIALSQNLANPQLERVVTLSGTARNIARMTLNGHAIYTDASGYFTEDVILENGYTIVTLQAEDRYGRIRKYSREFVYNHSTSTEQRQLRVES
jgi:hypothetical protein